MKISVLDLLFKGYRLWRLPFVLVAVGLMVVRDFGYKAKLAREGRLLRYKGGVLNSMMYPDVYRETLMQKRMMDEMVLATREWIETGDYRKLHELEMKEG